MLLLMMLYVGFKFVQLGDYIASLARRISARRRRILDANGLYTPPWPPHGAWPKHGWPKKRRDEPFHPSPRRSHDPDVQDADVLRHNMEEQAARQGIDLDEAVGEDWEAAHVVPANIAKGAPSRQLLDDLHLDVNGAENGCALPRDIHRTRDIETGQSSRLHQDETIDKLNERLIDRARDASGLPEGQRHLAVDDQGNVHAPPGDWDAMRDAVVAELDLTRAEMAAGEFPL